MTDEKVMAELMQIEEKYGILRPENVVSYAENPKTVLHSKFEWDDSAAGHQWRLQQARMLIRVVVKTESLSGKEERVYVSLKKDRYDEGGGYRTLVKVMSDREMREQLLADALDEMDVFKAKYGKLKELARIFEEADRVRVRIKGKKRKPAELQASA
jgi:hypothetical protein